jgi:endogenous inhibitor of DNA gyrase (YacG/DUF329 family)
VSERTASPGVSCPACGHKLTRGEQRRMNTWFGAARPTTCSSCGRSIQWHRSLHVRILFGGLIFRLGALALLVLAVCAPLLPGLPVPYGMAAVVAAAVAVAGVFVTYTPASRTLVELASNDA